MNKSVLSVKCIVFTSTVMLFSLYSKTVVSQDCNQIISDAELLYEKGKLIECINKVRSCLKDDSKDIRFGVYRILTMAFLANNETDSARNMAIEMLKLNPRYKPNFLRDPAEMKQLVGSITIIPRFSLGLAISIGSNQTIPKIVDSYLITDQIKTYTGRQTTVFGVHTSYQFTRSLSVTAMVRALSKEYDLSYSFEDWQIDVNEILNYIQLPMMARYSPELQFRVRPFVQAGAYIGRLIYTDNSFSAFNSQSNSSFSLEHISAMNRRKTFDWGYCGGLGLMYKLGEGHIILQANYFPSQTTIALESTRYQRAELLYSYYYLDDDVKLNNYSFSIGYSVFLNYKVLQKS